MLIAVYSRKSKWTGRGDSVENQIVMCREYIEKNIEGSENAEVLVYEDEGFSGKNTKRPQFQKMLQDMKLRHFQYLVCYRLDRLGRNVADLALLIEKLNQEKTEFISIKERFDTTTPMGKAMLYFSGVLAQMEREQIAERVRDNMVMLAKAGRWLGGNTPLGFQTEERSILESGRKPRKAYYLKVDEKEIRIVVLLFQEFLKNQSLAKTAKSLSVCGIYTRNGKAYTSTAVRDILVNPVYCTADKDALEYFYEVGCQICLEETAADGKMGLISYGKTVSSRYKGEEKERENWIIAPGKHRGIISGKDYVKVQKILERNKSVIPCSVRIHNETCLLSGVLFCTCGCKMKPKYYSVKQKLENGERKFSYRCPCRDKTHGEQCQVPPVRGNKLDEELWKTLIEMTEKKISLYDVFLLAEKEIKEQVLENMEKEGLIQEQIEKKREEIRKLTDMIAEWKEEKVYYRPVKIELEKRLEEIEKLENEAKKITENMTDNSRWETKKELLDIFRTFKKISSTFSVTQKRNYVQICIKKAVWDGTEVQVK